MNQELRDKLIGADAENPALRAEYERKLAALLEPRLTWYRRTGLVFAMIVCVATVIIAAVVASRFRHGPSSVLAGMAVGAGFGLAGLFLCGRIAIRGTYRMGRDSTAQAGLIWVFVVLLVSIFMVAGGISSIQGVGLTVDGIVFLIGAGLMLLRSVIEDSERRTREKLLELQYELAQISQSLRNKQG